MKGFTLVISMAAKQDLEGIYHFSLENWGVNQAEHYLTCFKTKLSELSNNPNIGQKRQDLLTNTRSILVGHHIIFYRISSLKIHILRVLHERQDPTQQVE